MQQSDSDRCSVIFKAYLIKIQPLRWKDWPQYPDGETEAPAFSLREAACVWPHEGWRKGTSQVTPSTVYPVIQTSQPRRVKNVSGKHATSRWLHPSLTKMYRWHLGPTALNHHPRTKSKTRDGSFQDLQNTIPQGPSSSQRRNITPRCPEVKTNIY